MFRTAVRRFAMTAVRSAETAAQMEAGHAHSIAISKVQGTAHNGLIDGTL